MKLTIRPRNTASRPRFHLPFAPIVDIRISENSNRPTNSVEPIFSASLAMPTTSTMDSMPLSRFPMQELYSAVSRAFPLKPFFAIGIPSRTVIPDSGAPGTPISIAGMEPPNEPPT